MTRFKGKVLASGAAIGAAVLLAAGGGYIAHAQPPGAVNAPQSMAGGGPGSFADIVARVAPAVVSINVVEKAQAAPTGFNPFGQGSPFGPGGPFGQNSPFGFQFSFPQTPGNPPSVPVHASGSGFFVSADGFIVTNNHVVDGAEKITVVTNDQRSLPAHVVGRDAATDLAVIKVDGGPFQYVSFEDRARPRVGDWVVAVGNPFGLGGTATAGIVSALGRQNVSGSSFVNFMQIDAPINRGNSGGPTFDIEGRVVGINTSIYTPSGGSVGIGFDIPADVAARVTHQLMSGGQVTRGYIGATVQNLSPDLSGSLGLTTAKGALIDQVEAGGPAERAGLQAGDIVTSVNDVPVRSSTDLTQQIALARPGEAIRLGVLRNGRAREIAITSGLRPSENALAAGDAGAGGGQDSGPLGLQVAPDARGGLVIEGVSPDSDAAQRGLRPGDVILRAGAST
ncbi:MAG TPA: trypsin-like peptidase domain-containing protein, partial [Caulobacteraceae bacterium]|nr:trypsin-like peptidase domain-containing protein [Caulobacteraceae bacterium]